MVDTYTRKGNPISFMDLSHNALSHSWTIDEGCCFIKGEFNKADTVSNNS